MRRIFSFDLRDGNLEILYCGVPLHTNGLWSATAYKVVKTPLI